MERPQSDLVKEWLERVRGFHRFHAQQNAAGIQPDDHEVARRIGTRRGKGGKTNHEKWITVRAAHGAYSRSKRSASAYSASTLRARLRDDFIISERS